MHDKMVNSSHAKNSCGKRKCVVLSLQSKIVILDDLKAGVTQESWQVSIGSGVRQWRILKE